MLRKITFVFFLAIAVFATSGFSCTGPAVDPALFEPVTLNYWRVFDDSDSMDEIIAAYEETHPFVHINYRKLRYEEYEQELLSGFADDRGPDIFSIHASWMDKYRAKIAPIPQQWIAGSEISEQTDGRPDAEPVRRSSTMRGLTPADMRKAFVDTVAADAIRTDNQQERIYGLPLGTDALSLFYNKDLFSNAGILEPPRSWQEFQDAIVKITRRNPDDDTELLQSAAAIGTAGNINRSFDIVSIIMAQNGAILSDERGAVFDAAGAADGANPAADGLIFYTDFAHPGKEGIYTWNEDMPDSVEAFKQGRTAMMFGYSYHAKLLSDTAPRLRFGVVPMPQLDPAHPATAASYWLEAVSKKASSAVYGWDFLQFAADQKNVGSYLARTGKPAALRSLLAGQSSEDIQPFSSQSPYAKNWYHGKSPAEAEAAFADMITSALHSKGGSRAEQRSRALGFVQRAAQKIRYGW